MARADSSVIISRFRPRVNPFFNLFLTLFESFSSESGFSRDKSCIFLRYCWKNAEFESLRLIEKFAKIHRQVSLRSLTAVGLGVPTCFFRLNPFQLQNAPHSALKLLFLFLKWSYFGLPPKPAWGVAPNPSKELRSLHPLSAARN